MAAEPVRQFVDTNILVYAYDATQREKHTLAKELLLSVWESGLGCVSIQVLQEFYVTVTRKSEIPLSTEQAILIIQDFSDWTIHRPDVKDVVAAVELHHHYKISFWDAMILQSARQSGCAILWSEDLSEGENFAGVKVINPFELI
jgi:predicted nucleic acid-binding protein